jgi:hypothetical protein
MLVRCSTSRRSCWPVTGGAPWGDRLVAEDPLVRGSPSWTTLDSSVINLAHLR